MNRVVGGMKKSSVAPHERGLPGIAEVDNCQPAAIFIGHIKLIAVGLQIPPTGVGSNYMGRLNRVGRIGGDIENHNAVVDAEHGEFVATTIDITPDIGSIRVGRVC